MSSPCPVNRSGIRPPNRKALLRTSRLLTTICSFVSCPIDRRKTRILSRILETQSRSRWTILLSTGPSVQPARRLRILLSIHKPSHNPTLSTRDQRRIASGDQTPPMKPIPALRHGVYSPTNRGGLRSRNAVRPSSRSCVSLRTLNSVRSKLNALHKGRSAPCCTACLIFGSCGGATLESLIYSLGQCGCPESNSSRTSRPSGVLQSLAIRHGVNDGRCI